MALPIGDITLGQVATELGIALPLTLGDSRVRTLAGIGSGTINLGSLRGKSAYALPTVVTDTVNIDEYGSDRSVSGYANLTISGGEAPFAVAWSRVSGSAFVTVSGTTAATFNVTGAPSFSYAAVFRATVTDNRGNQVATPNINVSISSSVS